MKKMYFGALLAIAGVLSTCVSEAKNLRRLNDRPKGDHTNSTLAEMRKCHFVVPTTMYMEFLSYITNDYLVNEGFVFNPVDSMFHGRIEGYFDDVPIKPLIAGRMLTVWQNYTRVMQVEFGADTMYTFGIDTNLKFADAPRLQKAWEDYFVVLDLADLPGFEQAKAIGWHRIFVLASCWCANPIMRKCLRQDPAPPPMQAAPIERSELKPANQATGGPTYVYHTNIVNSGNTSIASAAPVPPMNGYYPGGGYPMYQPAPPMMVIMPRVSSVCRMQYEGGYQQCGRYRLPQGCNQPQQRRPKPVYPVRPILPDKPTVRNVKIHQNPGFNTQTDGVTVVKDHDAPGTGGTTRNGGRPPLNPDAPPATVDMPRGAYGSGARIARERYRAPYDQSRQPSYGVGSRGTRSMGNGRQMQQMQRQQPMRPAMQAAPRSYPQPSGMRMYGNAGSGYRQVGGYSRGGGGRR